MAHLGHESGGMNMVTLTQGDLQILVAPELGGRITSVLHLPTARELLFQNPDPGSSRPWPSAGNFYDPWAWGWDECWPLVTPENPTENDHGDLWCQRASVTGQSSSHLSLSLQGLSVPAAIEKSIALTPGGLEISLGIRNTGGEVFGGFWTSHPLFQVSPDMQIFPEVALTNRRFLGRGNSPFEGPLPAPGTHSKFWVEPGRKLPTKVCGVRYPSLGMEARFELLAGAPPFLGYWVTHGGFQGDLNAAWEFSDGFHDRPTRCRENGQWPIYQPGEIKTFAYRLKWGPV